MSGPFSEALSDCYIAFHTSDRGELQVAEVTATLCIRAIRSVNSFGPRESSLARPCAPHEGPAGPAQTPNLGPLFSAFGLYMALSLDYRDGTDILARTTFERHYAAECTIHFTGCLLVRPAGPIRGR